MGLSLRVSEPEVILQIIEDMDLVGRQSDSETEAPGEVSSGRKPAELPLYEHSKDNSDNLRDVSICSEALVARPAGQNISM